MLSTIMNHLKTQPLFVLLLSFIGFISFLKSFIIFLKWIFFTFLRTPKNLVQSYGSWALITGTTDGIGKAFAFQLAQKGLNLILVARNLNKLQQVCYEIQTQNPNIKVKIIVVDFSFNVTKEIQEMKKGIEGLDIGVLINNVGVTYPRAMFFHEVDENIWKNIVKVNLQGTTLVTMAVLPGMISRRKGAIVNIGSGASIVVPSHPLFSIYAATKAYIDQFSRCLYVEYKHHGIDVQCQVPLYVKTKMTSRVASIEKSSLFSPTPEKYAKAGVAQIGYGWRSMPYWPHSIQWWFASLLPQSLLDAWRLSIGLNRRIKT
ncbi:very-long-chain 3-oxoacyl-CoA reductase-like protein At1g24470 [Solanum stenotomum]|uniref:very-long-chain 3-oxoacyl-CoA reductase-like protein At1g24470 n=1 Tax=Solanum stenotomum TaxID=172797 RepID=UPI0020D09B3D|nr:very-long-chain 3-oxoacyl-CoA reductase-like protein At1g24470 [Solanum stenotomum]